MFEFICSNHFLWQLSFAHRSMLFNYNICSWFNFWYFYFLLFVDVLDLGCLMFIRYS